MFSESEIYESIVTWKSSVFLPLNIELFRWPTRKVVCQLLKELWPEWIPGRILCSIIALNERHYLRLKLHVLTTKLKRQRFWDANMNALYGWIWNVVEIVNYLQRKEKFTLFIRILRRHFSSLGIICCSSRNKNR